MFELIRTSEAVSILNAGDVFRARTAVFFI